MAIKRLAIIQTTTEIYVVDVCTCDDYEGLTIKAKWISVIRPEKGDSIVNVAMLLDSSIAMTIDTLKRRYFINTSNLSGDYGNLFVLGSDTAVTLISEHQGNYCVGCQDFLPVNQFKGGDENGLMCCVECGDCCGLCGWTHLFNDLKKVGIYEYICGGCHEACGRCGRSFMGYHELNEDGEIICDQIGD